jgi:hypothetical protein
MIAFLAPGALERFPKGRPAVGVDHTGPPDHVGIREQIGELREDWSVRAPVSTCRQQDRDAEGLGRPSQPERIVLDLFGRHVVDDLHQTGLVVDKQQHAVDGSQSLDRAIVLAITRNEILRVVSRA